MQYSLASLRATIFDALASCAFPVSGRYVPILRKSVYPKVFEEVFPFYEIRDSSDRIWYVNLATAKLPTYIARLQSILDSYFLRLGAICQRNMDQQWRDQLSGLHSNEELMEFAQRFALQVGDSDINLMVSEIEGAARFLKQAQEMHEVWKTQPPLHTPPPPLSSAIPFVPLNPRELGLILLRRSSTESSNDLRDRFYNGNGTINASPRPSSRHGTRFINIDQLLSGSLPSYRDDGSSVSGTFSPRLEESSPLSMNSHRIRSERVSASRSRPASSTLSRRKNTKLAANTYVVARNPKVRFSLQG